MFSRTISIWPGVIVRSRRSSDSVLPLKAAAVLVGISPLTSCASGGQPWVELKGQRFAVEVADDHDERARGLIAAAALFLPPQIQTLGPLALTPIPEPAHG